ncbi:siroheme decarboxylase subunit alpha [Dethiosulfatarculus sandiegensis]|uniref:siroheme decarboxylase n=1 Tax=Dethiosulfatarculus sandiegensis TaxID=1429043 RepID=A0A0D2JBS9_9BACT|nr:AsnC family transcriptional regulator [Dethiosulfatarculus sandiegensis]KIX15599.1 transcriptional regulator [Dethiosulfatarculus sandiegensis]
MDQTDKAILREVQSNLPISETPFLDLGQKLGLSEEEVLSRLAGLKKSGVIRRIGGNFQSSRLGFTSTLCAAKVPSEKLDQFVEAVNAYDEVTHNYLRDHEFNVWFTFIAPSMDYIEKSLKALAEKTGVKDIYSFPSKKLFKIQVDFKV